MIAKTSTRVDLALLLLRLMLAAVFLLHGSQKLFGGFGGHGIAGTAGWLESIGVPFPTLSALLTGGAEFFGALALLLGVGARLATVPMAFAMLVAAFVAHGGAFDIQKGGMEYPLSLAVFLIALGLLGPGRWTLPALIRRARGVTTSDLALESSS